MASNTFGTKAYTLASLIKEVSSISYSQGRTAAGVISALSPRSGANSVKLAVINKFLNGRLYTVLGGASAKSGTPRTRLLQALRARKSV